MDNEVKMGTYTLSEVKTICDLVEKYQLGGRDVLKLYSIEEIAKIYNGAGPDSWPEIGREILTNFMSLFKPVIMIHDLNFDRSDGTEETFQTVTARWKTNCRIIMEAEYPFWTIKQLDRQYRRDRAYWFVEMELANLAISGDSARVAWKAAYNRNKSNPETKGIASV